MSDTPGPEIYAAHKNDVYEFVDPEWDWVVPADFARRLERERNEAYDQLAQYRAAVQTLAEKDFGASGWNEQCNQAAILLRNLLKKP